MMMSRVPEDQLPNVGRKAGGYLPDVQSDFLLASAGEKLEQLPMKEWRVERETEEINLVIRYVCCIGASTTRNQNS